MKVKTTGFAKGIIVLLISQILIKIFGVIYSLYMTNKSGFGDTGNAIYMSGYQVYALLLTISSMGVPNSISKLISEKDSIKDYRNANRVFYVSILLFSIIGFMGCLLLFIFSEIIANSFLFIPEAKLSLMILSPAILFVSISSVIRGYCNGENKIIFTAKSQFFEQVLKSLLTVFLVEIVSRISNNNVELMAAAANSATTFATFFSMIYIIVKYKMTYKNVINNKYNSNLSIKLENKVNIFPKESIKDIFKKIVKISLPITISALLTSFCKNIDSVTIVRILKKYLSESDAIQKYGIISSKIDILIAFPLSFNTSISVALIPEIARRKAKNDIKGIEERIKTAIFLSLVIGIPAAFGMFFYSKEIFLLLFPNAIMGEELLKLASISIVFLSLSQTITGILQGLGKNSVPLYATFISIIAKLICNIILINIKGVYEKGAIIGNIVLSIIMFLIEIIYLKNYINIKINLKSLIKGCTIVISSVSMIVISNRISKLLNNVIILNYKISICICIFNCIIVYFAVCYFLLSLIKRYNRKNNYLM